MAAALLAGCGPSDQEIRQRGAAHFELGNLQQAEADFQNVLIRWPADPDSLYYMGRIRYAEGLYEQAMYYFQSAIDADPSYESAKLWLQRARQKSGVAGPVLQIIPESVSTPCARPRR